MKKALRSILAIALIASVLCVSVSAVGPIKSQTTITYFDDGSYSVSYMLSSARPATRASTAVTDGVKAVEYYNSSDELCFIFTVIGTFSYNGRTATATSSDYDYEVFVSGWSLGSADSYCSGNTAYAEGTFERFLSRDVVVETSLSCSPDGNLY